MRAAGEAGEISQGSAALLPSLWLSLYRLGVLGNEQDELSWRGGWRCAFRFVGSRTLQLGARQVTRRCPLRTRARS